MPLSKARNPLHPNLQLLILILLLILLLGRMTPLTQGSREEKWHYSWSKTSRIFPSPMVCILYLSFRFISLQIIDHLYLGKSYQDILNIYKIIDKCNVVPGNKNISSSFCLYIAKQSLYSIFVLGKKRLKGLVHPKMKILPLITHPHVVSNPWDLRSSNTN